MTTRIPNTLAALVLVAGVIGCGADKQEPAITGTGFVHLKGM